MSWNTAQESLARSLPGYESRTAQTGLAHAIENAFTDNAHLMAQAGCGTGKSFAALIPAIEHSLKTGRPVIIATATRALQNQYCLAPETRVLTADLRYIPVGSVTEGMVLAGFDEERQGTRRRFRKAVVESAELIELPCYELTFDDGTKIVSSSDHKWLVARGMAVKWMTTKQLCVTAGKRPGSKVIRLFDTWETDSSYQAGYIAAGFDGEGHLGQKITDVGHSNVLVFSQKHNEMYSLMQKFFAELGIQYRVGERPDICQMMVSGRRDIVRVLGQCRPERLLAQFDFDLLGTINTRRNRTANGQRVVEKKFLGVRPVMAVSTSTHTLIAEGLASHNCNKDLPFLQQHLGLPFTFAQVQGRGNYICQDKLNDSSDFSEIQDEIAQNPDFTGEFDSLVTPIDQRMKPQLTSGTDECPGAKNCTFGQVCFAQAAKQRAQEADIVVVNHSLLVTDLMLREKSSGRAHLLPDFGAVVIDEAHEFESYATSALGSEFTQNSLANFGTEAGHFLADLTVTGPLTSAAERLFTRLGRYLGSDKSKSLTDRALVDFEEIFVPAIQALRNLVDQIHSVVVRGDDDKLTRRRRLEKRGNSLIDKLVDVVTADAAELVRWVESDLKRGTILKYAPLSVAGFLADHLWVEPQFEFVGEGDTPATAGSKRAAILLSATLAMGSDFTYIARTLGIANYQSFDAGTPFDYPRQSALYVPVDCDPAANASAWRAKVAGTIEQLVIAAGGRALLLFTSRTAMDAAYDATAELIRAEGCTVLRQGEQPNGNLSRIFKEDETSVLFALKSFMTGIDIQGDSLRLVVIDKLPFPVPTDVLTKARADAVDAQVSPAQKWTHGSFATLTIPEMALTLAQAFGRLIRTQQDEGLVCILDDRLRTKKYGPKIVRALPPARQMASLPDARSYLLELTKRRG